MDAAFADSWRSYLIAIATLSGLSGQKLASFQEAIDRQDAVDLLNRFSLYSELTTIFIDGNTIEGIFVSTDLISLQSTSCLAVVKSKDGPLDQYKPLFSQLQLTTVTHSCDNGVAHVINDYYSTLQQFTKHVYTPILVKFTQQSGDSPTEDENIKILQRRVRELDIALEQCQRGSMAPSIILPVAPSLIEPAKLSTTAILRSHLDKYNASLVDQLFADINLNSICGTTQEQKEEFANEVNKSAKQWPIEISKQVRLVDSSFPSSIESEIEFWKDLEKKIGETKEQLESCTSVLLTKLVLKRTNRVSEQLIKESEANVDKVFEIAQASVSFLRDYPIEDVISASDLHPKLSKSISICLQHFSRLKHSKYDFNRALRLLEVTGITVSSKLLMLLKESNIMQSSFDGFCKVKKQADEVFLVWETQYALQRTNLKDIAKRKNEKLRTLVFDIEALQSRLNAVYDFREQHEKILSIFSTVLLYQGDSNDISTYSNEMSTSRDEVIVELDESYQALVRSLVDIFDITPAGGLNWTSARQLYERKLEKTEEKMTKLLEMSLNKCQSADEMFKVFSFFNPLFFRPAIRNAVNSFRTVLLRNVRDDIKKLETKFKFRYDESNEKKASDARDIPPLAGRIIWARQIDNQLTTVMKRMEDVLGAGWEDHFEGKELKETCTELRNYLDTDKLYSDWLSEQLKVDQAQKYGKFKDFLLLVNSDNSIKVNFDEKQVVIFKEVRYLEWLLPGMTTVHKSIPLTIRAQSKECYNRYPVAMALSAALNTFSNVKLSINESNSLLLANHIQTVREVIKEAFGGNKKNRRWIKWDSDSSDLNDWVSSLTNKIFALQERVDDVNERINKINELVNLLSQCEYSRQSFDSIMTKLQQCIDDMQVRGLAHVTTFIQEIDKKVESILTIRAAQACNNWVNAFISPSSSYISGPNGIDTIYLDQTVHEILLSNQLLYLNPSLEVARTEWLNTFHHHIQIVSALPRIVSHRYDVFSASDSSTSLDAAASSKFYTNIMYNIDGNVLSKAYFAIEDKLIQASNYSQLWLQYQALWDISVSFISDKLGSDIPQWRQLLSEVKDARNTIDTVSNEEIFGPIVINYSQVQNKINMKYDMWQKDLQVRFGIILLSAIKETFSVINSDKTVLEDITYLSSATDITVNIDNNNIIAGIENILRLKFVLPERKQYVNELEQSEKLLYKQRYIFPNDWFAVSNVTGILNDFIQILDRRHSSMTNHLPALQLKIKEEDIAITNRTDEVLGLWVKNRPSDGNKNPHEVIAALNLTAVQITNLIGESARIKSAKEALGMPVTIGSDKSERLNLTMAEISDMKEAWTAILPSDEKLASNRNMALKEVAHIKLRKSLDEILNDLRNLPPKIRSYHCVDSMMDTINKYLSYQPLVKDICSDALKDRHWKLLLTLLGVSSFNGANSITLGLFWDSNPNSHKKAIQEVLSTAQGELAIEQFLKEIRDIWMNCELNLITRDSVKLIVGWDVHLSMLEDNLNSLTSLKQSPYYNNVTEFQEDCINWENRLTSLRSIFIVWIDVQKKWIYLRGIFKNADIKSQLPSQYSKFKSIDNEMILLMKRIGAKPAVMELLQVDSNNGNLLRQLERQDSTMTIIQKALGDYLEKQRQIFPRFYFVNNDDLVEIIGNANEPVKIVTHISKMFAAISTISFETPDDASTKSNVLAEAVSMSSKEGEVVIFSEKITITNDVKEWLQLLVTQMVSTLEALLNSSLLNIPSDTNKEEMMLWLETYPALVLILASQILWTQSMETAISSKSVETSVLKLILDKLLFFSNIVLLTDISVITRKKCEQLLTELVYQRDVTRSITASVDSIQSKSDFKWLYHLRFYKPIVSTGKNEKIVVRMANASFNYGYEYLGIGERLVQTPLTDRCYLTLTQALHYRMGANPFGPAGTGKTESVKMLGTQLGRFVLVFNCDSAFDYAAMGRIFSGLCQVGAWGCFDEFNRLEERILSAVSQQILTIQHGLLAQIDTIQLLGNTTCKLHKDVGIFVTLNPGYAGRSNLPDNLKQLFRAVAMVVPDRKQIAQVMLYSQGITTAEELSGKITLLFTLCEEQLSVQSHYDFGLRALKSVLTGAGDLKRKAIASMSSDIIMAKIEVDVLIKSACDSVLPKLVSDDIPLFRSLLKAVFPDSDIPKLDEVLLINTIKLILDEDHLEYSEEWVGKILQLKQVLDMRHGVMLVGPSGSGKSTAWKALLKALSRLEGVKGDSYLIDPKSVQKDKLYGHLDPNTLEWTDGIFTKIVRKVVDNASDNSSPRRSWIIFDGDVDPEWAENLNSVLDDNKVLTLPSGDRLKLTNNIRIMMEVDSLQYATLATVSRCGMVWFAKETLHIDHILRHLVQLLKHVKHVGSANKQVLDIFVNAIGDQFMSSGLVGIGIQFSMQHAAAHIMQPSVGQLVSTMHSLLMRGVQIIIEHNEANPEFPVSENVIYSYAKHYLLYSILWACGGSMPYDKRLLLSNMLLEHSINITLPNKCTLLDVYVSASDGLFYEWSSLVPKMEIESHKVISSDVVISTTDTVRHIDVIKAWLGSHKPLILCGPPGSGKTMSLSSVLDSNSDYILASLNFSSGTTPDVLLKTFAQYCEVVDSPDGLVMQPNRQVYRPSQWLVVFCDEINLPDVDLYGTQRVIMFLRQLIEQGGYWNKECKWVILRNVQFVGACNPPSDAGRKVLSSRFLRHVPLLYVDYPHEESLKQIYRCFNHALLKLHPNLKGFVDPLNTAMVEFYLSNQKRFTVDIAPQYIYSPRELSRWVRAMYEAMSPLDAMSADELVRLWAHEALRLFQDRLITSDEKEWCYKALTKIAGTNFSNVNLTSCLELPMFYSNWISNRYCSVDKEELRAFISARLRVFYEEELDVSLVIFDDVMEHVLRIDNVLRHPLGHILLVGESGAGKTVLTRFVAWMNGLSVFQIKANSKYTIDNFDEDLRVLLRRVGVDGEKICFIFDESNALSSAFLERMNALLASGEVPGLFEGDERVQLMAACRDSLMQREGIVMDSADDLWRKFTSIIQRNLHVVFTMNPASGDFSNRCVTSPALFNRCVVDWFGTWSAKALIQVGREFTLQLDTGYTTYQYSSLSSESMFNISNHEKVSDTISLLLDTLKVEEIELQEAVVISLVNMHNIVKQLTIVQAKSSSQRVHYLSPRDFLDFIKKFQAVDAEKRDFLEDQQRHIRTGLLKLLETQDQVGILRSDMVSKEAILKQKDIEANHKLNIMIDKQNEAENKKLLSETLTVELEKQNCEIRIRKEEVEKELSEAEPALLAAKQSVQNIRKPQLDEVRALARPPNAVRLTMEMVSIMIGEKNMEWTEIRKVIRREDFIPTVVNFDPLTLNNKQVVEVQRDYLDNPELNYDTVDRASKACGPLYEWAVSQIKYATILKKVKPLRDEVDRLQEKGLELVVKQKEAIEQTTELEMAIKQYKIDYAAAIRDTEIIRAEMDSVSKKVSRAEALLLSLEQEKDRWQSTSATFDKQMSTLIGDSLLAGAFLTYSGIFDHRHRKVVWREWIDVLNLLNIPYSLDKECNDHIINYLSTPAERLMWQQYGLPSDELAIQNSILLDRFNRYPLIIDPSGQALSFVINKYNSMNSKVIQTSFLDINFMKTLASAIRFGNILLVNDVETIDPILNPILNKELQKTGGRSLIRLGSEDIDFSPKFVIILATRNPLAIFSPDICSRVTLVNFTITRASLLSQAVSIILKSERPDVDKRYRELMALQTEQNIKLRALEEQLLNKISQVQGAILDDDTVINSLELIKGEAKDLNLELLKTKEVMNDVQSISKSYEHFARVVTNVYFTLEALSDINYLYQFSLPFILQILNKVLLDCNTGETVSDSGARIKKLSTSFYCEISRRVLRALKYEDQILFVLQLAQISSMQDRALNDDEYNYLVNDPPLFEADESVVSKYRTLINGVTMSESVAKRMMQLTKLPCFSNILADMAANSASWCKFHDAASPEMCVPMGWLAKGDSNPVRLSLLQLMLVKTIRPDKVLAAIEQYIAVVFGMEEFKWHSYCGFDLINIINVDSKNNVPIIICSATGHDVSNKVERLASFMNKPLLSVSMGSSEGFAEADKSITLGMKSGSWVLLRNVHLCVEWLGLLEKRIHSHLTLSGNSSASIHENYRLFLTCEGKNSSIPVSLLRSGEVIIAEASTGMKANILRFFSSIPLARIEKPPVERARLYALVAWLNGIIQERLRYSPFGWTKHYEFSEADAVCTIDVVDQWIDDIAGTRAHINPEDIPWQALRTLLSQSLYGGRIDHPYDQAALDSFINSIFNAKSYATAAALVTDNVTGESLVTLPDSLQHHALEQWIASTLPENNSPSWIGLPVSADSQLQILTGQSILHKLSTLKSCMDEDISTDTSTQISASASVSINEIEKIQQMVTKWFTLLPDTDNAEVGFTAAVTSAHDINSSQLQRCLAREIVKGFNIIGSIRRDLDMLQAYCRGTIKVSNDIRFLIDCFTRNKVPNKWCISGSATGLSVSSYISDVHMRWKSLQPYANVVNAVGSIPNVVYTFGNMFSPESFITAIRQHCAYVTKWSLEDLELYLELGESTCELVGQDTVVSGLVLEGVTWDAAERSIKLSHELHQKLQLSRLRWKRKDERNKTGNYMNVPVYLDTFSRSHIVMEVLIAVPTLVPQHVWLQRGVCFLLNG